MLNPSKPPWTTHCSHQECRMKKIRGIKESLPWEGNTFSQLFWFQWRGIFPKPSGPLPFPLLPFPPGGKESNLSSWEFKINLACRAQSHRLWERGPLILPSYLAGLTAGTLLALALQRGWVSLSEGQLMGPFISHKVQPLTSPIFGVSTCQSLPSFPRSQQFLTNHWIT